MTNTQQAVELSVEEVQAKVDLLEALTRLESNPDFKLVVLDGFLKENVLRMASLVSSPNEAMAKGALNSVIGKGALEAYFRAIGFEGESAKTSLAEHHKQRLQAMQAEA